MGPLHAYSLLLHCYVAIQLLAPTPLLAIEPILFNGDQHRLRYSDGPNGWVEANDELRIEIQTCQNYQCFSDRVRVHVNQYNSAQRGAQLHLQQLPPAFRQSIENCSTTSGRSSNETLIDCQLRALGNNMSASSQALRRAMTQMKDEAVRGMALAYSCGHAARPPAGQCSTMQASCCPDFMHQLSGPESTVSPSQPTASPPAQPENTTMLAPGTRDDIDRWLGSPIVSPASHWTAQAQ